ncbi:hypothetical protein DEQ92_20225 [Haloferax sp. Atlit-6N]|uniref:hypothetical protein n=1 Tax=Haloferax sp. Atlit-6N TaxID=2077205 RepID=UPI000E2538C4|nr:hypothetical protein [Haloferax sp. Atlit-6N]REA00183.1 hypothetical protein DEQ92_20225 [Haloferax sp. Atlit-6N]
MPTRLTGAVLEVDANLGGQQRTGIFSLRKDFNLVSDLRREYLVGPVGELGARLIGVLEDETGEQALDGVGTNRKGFVIDAGAGTRSYEITVSLSETEFGDLGYLQMGDTGDETTLTAYDATGADGRDQDSVLGRYLEEATTDSANPAFLHIGHYHDGTYSSDGEAGLYGKPRPVHIPEGPRVVESDDEPSTVEVQITCHVVGSFAGPIDKAVQEAF